jgi:hypothetical protein
MQLRREKYLIKKLIDYATTRAETGTDGRPMKHHGRVGSIILDPEARAG